MNAMQFPMAPIKLIISKAPMNMIDFLAIVPFYLSLLLEGLEDFEIIGKAGKIIRLVKVTFVVRIVVEHSFLAKKCTFCFTGDADSAGLSPCSSLCRLTVSILHPPTGIRHTFDIILKRRWCDVTGNKKATTR